MIKNWHAIRTSTVFKLGVTVGVSYVLYLLAPFLLPILLAIALSFALYPLVNLISRLTVGHGTIHISRVVSIIFVLLCFITFLTILISVLVLPLFGQINDLVQNLPELTSNGSMDAWFTDKTKIPKLPSNYDMLVQDVLAWAMGMVGTMMRNLLKSSLEIVTGLVGLIIVPFLAFYFLKDWHELRNSFVDLFKYEDQERVRGMLDRIGETLSAYVNGLGKLCLLSAICVTLALFALGVNYALVFGFVAIFAELIPVVGPLIAAIPAVFVAYGQEPALAYKAAAFYILYYQMDANYIMPRIMGSKIDLHPVVLIISLLLGAKLFGILGMVFAVPVAAVYKVLYKELWHIGEDTENNENKIDI